MIRLQKLSLFALMVSGCSGTPYAEITGEVAGHELGALTTFWGGPFMLIADQPLDCMDMSWVKRGTNFRDGDEAPLDEDVVALLFTYESDEVAVQNTSLEGDAPIDARLLVTRDGALAVYKATSGELDVAEFNKQDDVLGSFNIGFEDGNLAGDFQLEWCNNLKTRY